VTSLKKGLLLGPILKTNLLKPLKWWQYSFEWSLV